MPPKDTEKKKTQRRNTTKESASKGTKLAPKKRRTQKSSAPLKKVSTKRKVAGKRKKAANKKSKKRVFFLWLLKLAIAAIVLFALFFISVYVGFWGHIPTKNQLEEIKNPLASEVYSNEGKLLGRYYIENRSYVKFNEISPNVIHALIATEDARFYEHGGVDEWALLRVAVKSVLLGNRSAGGGSTLSQQAAKNLFPRGEGMLMMPANKLREAITAYRLEKIYTKDEILTLYLNTVPFGENIFGIGLASERFFSKLAIHLNVEEAAVLVGMLKANNTYNPRKNPDRSKERRNTVINQMVKAGYLTKIEGTHYQSLPLKLNYKVISYNNGPAPYFLAMLRPQLMQWCADNIKPTGEPYNLYTDGLQIKTTINYDYQIAAQDAVCKQMKKLQAVFDKHWESTKPWNDKWDIFSRAMKSSERYKSMKKAKATDKEIEEVFKTPIQMSVFHWDGIRDIKLSPNDSIKHALMMLHAGFLALEPQTGNIKAWVGGINFENFQYDYIKAQRQVGSTFKPIVYLAGLESGLQADQYFSNERKVYKEYQNWSPRNSHPDYSGYYSMSGALAKSVNTVAVNVLMQTGISNTISVAEQLGITANLPKYPSLALGVASISLEEMLGAYAAIINDGKYIEPHYLVSISDAYGNLLEEFKAPVPSNTHLNPDNTRAVVQMMKSVIDEGSGKAMRSTWGITGDLAGKTGTTQNNSDGWFIAATPNIVAGCWVGANNPSVHFRTIKYGQGAYMALPVVGQFYKSIYTNQKYNSQFRTKFKRPSAQTLEQLNIEPYKETLNRQERKEEKPEKEEKKGWFKRLRDRRAEKKSEQ